MHIRSNPSPNQPLKPNGRPDQGDKILGFIPKDFFQPGEGGGGPDPKALGFAALAAVVVGGVGLGMSTSVVGPQEYGVRYGPSGVSTETLEPGVHLHVPVVGGVRKWSAKQDAYFADNADITTRDEYRTTIDAEIPYQPKASSIPTLVTRYGSPQEFREQFVQTQFRAAIRTVAPNYTLAELQGIGRSADGQPIREKIADEIQDQFQENVAGFIKTNPEYQQVPASFGPVLLRDVPTPEGIAEARLATQKAQQSKLTAEAELEAAKARQQVETLNARTEAEVATTQAKGKADAQRLSAQGEADSIRTINKAQAEMSPAAVQLRLAEIRRDTAKDFGPDNGTLVLGGENLNYFLNQPQAPTP